MIILLLCLTSYCELHTVMIDWLVHQSFHRDFLSKRKWFNLHKFYFQYRRQTYILTMSKKNKGDTDEETEGCKQRDISWSNSIISNTQCLMHNRRQLGFSINRILHIAIHEMKQIDYWWFLSSIYIQFTSLVGRSYRW